MPPGRSAVPGLIGPLVLEIPTKSFSELPEFATHVESYKP